MQFMKEYTEAAQEDLPPGSRNLLSVAYKNVVGTRRSAWRVVSSLESRTDDQERITLIKGYREKIEKELDETCGVVLVRSSCLFFFLFPRFCLD